MENVSFSAQMSKENLAELMKKSLGVELAYVSHPAKVMHVRSLPGDLSSERLRAAQDKLLASGYRILIEYKTGMQRLKFVCLGGQMNNDMLAKKFGGMVSQNKRWVLNNEAHLYSWYGYTGATLPSAQEILQYMEGIPA